VGTNRTAAGQADQLEAIKKNRGESIADEVKRLIGSRTDEQIQRVLYELESVEPA
jgi:hypothetical protein